MATDHASRVFDVEATASYNDSRMQALLLQKQRRRSRGIQEEPRSPRPSACEQVEVVPVQHVPSPTSIPDEDEIQDDVPQLKPTGEAPHPDVAGKHAEGRALPSAVPKISDVSPRARRSRSPSLAVPLAACLSCNMQFKVAIDFRAMGCPACEFCPLPPRHPPKELVWARPIKLHALPAARRNMTTSQRKAEKRRRELEEARMIHEDSVASCDKLCSETITQRIA